MEMEGPVEVTSTSLEHATYLCDNYWPRTPSDNLELPSPLSDIYWSELEDSVFSAAVSGTQVAISRSPGNCTELDYDLSPLIADDGLSGDLSQSYTIGRPLATFFGFGGHHNDTCVETAQGLLDFPGDTFNFESKDTLVTTSLGSEEDDVSHTMVRFASHSVGTPAHRRPDLVPNPVSSGASSTQVLVEASRMVTHHTDSHEADISYAGTTTHNDAQPTNISERPDACKSSFKSPHHCLELPTANKQRKESDNAQLPTNTHELVFDLNMRAAQPRRLRTKTQDEKNSYLGLKRSGGACEMHRALKQKVNVQNFNSCFL